MSKSILFSLFLLLLTTFLSGQCTPLFIPLDCYGGLNLSLEQTFIQAKNRLISQRGFGNISEDRIEKGERFIIDPYYSHHLDSIFFLAKQYIIDQIGAQAFCQRVQFRIYDFSCHKMWKSRDIMGSLGFKFHYDPISCWSGSGRNLIFQFRIKDRKVTKITYPQDILKCTEDDCFYENPSVSEIGAKALQLGLIDGTEVLDVDYFDHATLELQKWENIFRQRIFLFDRKTGNYLGDTLKVNWHYNKNSLSHILEEHPVVVDATCVGHTEFENAAGKIYSTYIFKPHHTLKGKRNKAIFAVTIYGRPKMQLHGLSMPPVGGRRILFLKKLAPEIEQAIKEGPGNLQGYQQWGINYNPNKLLFNHKMKPYTVAFPYLVQATNSSLYRYHSVNHTSEKTMKWLAENRRIRLKKKQGLAIWLGNHQWNGKNNTLHSHLFAGSTKDFVCLKEKEFTFNYDTSLVAPYAVGKGLIDISRFKKYPPGWDELPEATLTQNYDLTLTDISAGSFKVNIKARSVDDLAHLSLENRKYKMSILFSLSFKIKEKKSGEKFSVTLEANPFKNLGTYYDPFSKKAIKFAYQRVIKPTRSSITIGKPTPSVSRVVPDSFSSGDTLTIFGQYLDHHTADIACPCRVIEKGIEFRRYCKLPEENVILKNDQQLQIVIPDYFDYNKQGLKKLYPISGTLKIENQHSAKITLNATE